jgi:hypothetical protein
LLLVDRKRCSRELRDSFPFTVIRPTNFFRKSFSNSAKFRSAFAACVSSSSCAGMEISMMCGSPTAVPLGMGYRPDRASVPRVEPRQRHARLLLLLLTYRKRSIFL